MENQAGLSCPIWGGMEKDAPSDKSKWVKPKEPAPAAHKNSQQAITSRK